MNIFMWIQGVWWGLEARLGLEFFAWTTRAVPAPKDHANSNITKYDRKSGCFGVYDRKIHSKKVYDTMCDFVYDTKPGRNCVEEQGVWHKNVLLEVKKIPTELLCGLGDVYWEAESNKWCLNSSRSLTIFFGIFEAEAEAGGPGEVPGLEILFVEVMITNFLKF